VASELDFLCDAIATDYIARTSDTAIVFRVGQLKRAQNDKPKRVVFVGDSGRVVPSKFTSSHSKTPIAALAENVTAHIYAPDREQADLVFLELIRSYDIVLGNAWQERSGDYERSTETEEGAGHTRRGHVIHFESVWRITKSEAQREIVTLESDDHAEPHEHWE
jgi:hypothetical protein